MTTTATRLDWVKYPLVAKHGESRDWLQILEDCGKAQNTLDAYARGLNFFLAFCERGGAAAAISLTGGLDPTTATRRDITAFIRELLTRPGADGRSVLRLESGAGLSNSTMQQRLTAVRLWFDYLMEEGIRSNNPVGRGKYTRGGSHGSTRGILPRVTREPWIPGESECERLLQAAAKEPLRNRLMFAIQYEGALRREELIGLRLADVDPGHRTISLPPEITKGKSRGRHVSFSAQTAKLLVAYFQQRARLRIREKNLFVSQSHRNRNKPLTASSWDKVVRRIRATAAVPRFTTHTLRHLRITDLARANWHLKEMMEYAGHVNPQTTLIYIHMSGRDIVHKFAKVDQRRIAQLESLTASLQ